MSQETAADRIVAAALALALDQPLEVISLPAPARHHNIVQHMLDQGYSRAAAYEADQGFVTATGRYVDRQEAWRIAEAAGQIVGQPAVPGTLLSEDVW